MSELQTERSPQARPWLQSATSSRPQDRGTEHDTTARDGADDARTVGDEWASGKTLEMSFLHGSVQCLWCVLPNDVEQFLSHVCVRRVLGHKNKLAPSAAERQDVMR